jgi:cytosine/adenosine deaminase-related metal-dependent hydrolase
MMLKSRYVVPVDGPVIENGAVVIRDGRIAAVGRADDLTASPVIDYGDAVICPGFVNSHTHLELTLLAGAVPPSRHFIDWLKRLTGLLIEQPATNENVAEAVRAGIVQSLVAGVTTIGDITRRPAWSRGPLAASPVRAVSFGEVIAMGRLRTQLPERLEAAASTAHQNTRLRIGISPHAPYTVEPDGLRTCAARALRMGAPLCIHLAETADEEAFTRNGGGRFVEFLQEVGIWDDDIPAAHCSPVELCRSAGILGPKTLITHGNYVSDTDISIIAASDASVAYCPRTHHAFGHAPHPFREMLKAGINVCIGTDSLASNPSLSILDELRFLRRLHSDLAALDLLTLGTLRGAVALGFDAEVGSLTVGKAADIVVIPLEASHAGADWKSVFESTQRPIAVYIDGVNILAAA